MAHSFKELCLYYGSVRGCRYGNNCRYSHSNPNSIPLCRYFETNTCIYGNRCKFRHRNSDNQQRINAINNNNINNNNNNLMHPNYAAPFMFDEDDSKLDPFQVEVDWKINNKQLIENIKNAKNGEGFTSKEINIGDIEFMVQYYPNGAKDDSNGISLLYLHCVLVETPNISKINVTYSTSNDSVSMFSQQENEDFIGPSDSWRSLMFPNSLINDNNKTEHITFKTMICIEQIYDNDGNEIDKALWKTYLNITDIKQHHHKSDYFGYLSLIVPYYICNNTKLTVPDPIKLIVFNYLNDFKNTVTFSVENDKLYDRMLNMKFKESISSKMMLCGDMQFMLQFYPNGLNLKGFCALYLEICSMSLMHKVSKIQIQFHLKCKELNYGSHYNFGFKLPESDRGFHDTAIYGNRLLNIKQISFECDMKIIEIYDENHQIVDRKDWNRYLNIGYNNIFKNKYLTKQFKIVRIDKLIRDIQYNGRVGKVVDFLPNATDYQYIIKLIHPESVEKLKNKQNSEEMIIYTHSLLLLAKNVFPF